jgi:hypothetical protein
MSPLAVVVLAAAILSGRGPASRAGRFHDIGRVQFPICAQVNRAESGS